MLSHEQVFAKLDELLALGGDLQPGFNGRRIQSTPAVELLLQAVCGDPLRGMGIRLSFMR